MFGYIIIFVLSICVIYSLKCYDWCQFQTEFNNSLTKNEEWFTKCKTITVMANVSYCSSIIYVDYIEQKSIMKLSIRDEEDESILNNFIQSPSKLTFFVFYIHLKPNKVFIFFILQFKIK